MIGGNRAFKIHAPVIGPTGDPGDPWLQFGRRRHISNNPRILKFVLRQLAKDDILYILGHIEIGVKPAPIEHLAHLRLRNPATKTPFWPFSSNSPPIFNKMLFFKVKV